MPAKKRPRPRTGVPSARRRPRSLSKATKPGRRRRTRRALAQDCNLELSVTPLAPLTAFTPRGRLLFPEEVASLVFNGRVSPEWCRRTVAPGEKVRMGHSTVAWFEQDVWHWVEDCRGA